MTEPSQVDRMLEYDGYTQNYTKMMKSLAQFDYIKYSAYRTAMKMMEIQKALRFDQVQLYDVAANFDHLQHRTVGQHDVVDMISLSKMISSLLSISNYTDSPYTKDMVMNFLQHTFDRKREGHIELLSCKTLLVILSQGSLESKVKFIFDQIKGHNNHVSKRHLARFLKVFVDVAEVLSEQGRFGIHLLPATIDTCFKQVSSVGISLDQFTEWMLKEPQMLVWWMIMYRLKYVESVVHYVTCDGCDKTQFKGLLFECLKCRDYYQCQDCFLEAKSTKGHLLEHPVQEQCKPRGLRRRRSMLKVVRRFFKRKKSPAREFLAIDTAVPPQHSISSLLGESVTDITELEETERTSRFAARTICQSRDLLETLDDFSLGDEKILEIGTPDLPRNTQSVRPHIETAIGELEAFLNLLKASRNMEMPSSLQASHMKELVAEIRKLTTRVTVALRPSPSSPVGRLQEMGPMESTPMVTGPNDRPRRIDFPAPQSPIIDNEDNHKAESNMEDLRQLSLATLSSIYSDVNANGSYWTCASQADLAEISGSDLTSLAPVDQDFEGYLPESSREKVMNVLKHFQMKCIDMQSIERLSEILYQKIEDKSEQFKSEMDYIKNESEAKLETQEAEETRL